MPQPWERQKGEPSLWYSRFRDYYLPQGPARTVEEAYRQCAKREGLTSRRPSGHWNTNSLAWEWLERAAAWDDAERQRRLAQEREILDTAHSNLVKALSMLVLNAANKIRQAGGDDASGGEMTLSQAIRAVEIAHRAIRLERGEATERVDETVRGILGVADVALTPEEEQVLRDALIGDDPEPDAPAASQAEAAEDGQAAT